VWRRGIKSNGRRRRHWTRRKPALKTQTATFGIDQSGNKRARRLICVHRTGNHVGCRIFGAALIGLNLDKPTRLKIGEIQANKF
jgi:hypothetical protein